MAGILADDELVAQECTLFNHSNGDYAYVLNRQTALESSMGAFSVSGWYIPSMNGLYAHRILGVRQVFSSETQWGINFNSPGLTTSANSTLRFLLFSNPSNFIYIDSDAPIKRNRPLHFVASWNGVNGAGMDLYINGVKQTTRSGSGTYTTAYSNSGLRFIMGREGVNDTLRGHVRDICIWNKKLSDTEAAEAYNNGRVKDPTTFSFYGDAIAFWPLRTDRVCVTNSNFNLSQSSAGITHVTRSFSVRSKRLSFKKATINNTRYVGLGSFVKVSDTLAYYIGRSGTSHVLGGKIVKIPIHLDTEVIDAPIDIITDGTYDLRGGYAGIMDGKIFYFGARYNGGTDTFIDFGYWESTDGLTGESYGSLQTFTPSLARFQAFGGLVAGFASGEYFASTSEITSTTDFKISLRKTTDNGATWSEIVVYNGSARYVEPALINMGNNTMMIMCRKDIADFGLWRILSTDGGATWDTPVQTNLGSALGASTAHLKLDEHGLVTVFWMDRGSDTAWASYYNKPADIIASPTVFNPALRLGNSYGSDPRGILGYPSAIEPVNNNWVVAYSAESSSSVADLYIGFGQIR